MTGHPLTETTAAELAAYREQEARVLDLADRLDAEAEELYDFSGGMSDESEWRAATATRLRGALKGQAND